MRVEQGLWTSDSKWEQPLAHELSDNAQLMLVFGSTKNFKQRVSIIDEVKKHYPSTKFLGCTTSGEIHGTEVNDESFTFTAIQLEKSKIESALVNVEELDFDSYQIGKALGEKLNKEGLKHVPPL